MPWLSRLDDASEKFTVDKFDAFAGGTSRATHPAFSHDWHQPLASSAVLRASVLRLVASPCRATCTAASRSADAPRRGEVRAPGAPRNSETG